MQNDFLGELGYLALASRLKRISDRMIHSGREMYKELGLDIEPNWYLIFKLLDEYEELSVTEISGYLQLSHPSVISIINKMLKKGYLHGCKCDQDGRKQLLTLTDKSKELLPKLKAIWKAGTEGVAAMVANDQLLPLLDHIEEQLQHKSFKERTIENLKNHGKSI